MSGDQPDSEALKLARELGCEIPSGPEGREFFFYPQELEAFYRKARADALRDAAEELDLLRTQVRELRHDRDRLMEYLERECGDKCNAEYNPCSARLLWNQMMKEKK